MSWVCAHCTFRHDDDAGAMFLACKLCGHARVCEATKRKCEVDHGNCEGGDQVERKRSRGFVGGSGFKLIMKGVVVLYSAGGHQ